ncbi:MAG: Atrophin-1 multi-domain protein [Massilia sp.]|uniref:Atrophin-1 multi-domain protein n=1 Tax=Massilia sp. TaxID=1882437 RepID=UPI002FCC661B
MKHLRKVDMTFLSSTMIRRIIPPMICASIAACDGHAAVDAQTATVAVQPGAADTNASAHGTYLRPYSATSLWNVRPVKPVFGTFVIPRSRYFPTVTSGAYSTGVFLASSSDKPMTVVGRGSSDTATNTVSDPDNGAARVITLPRWPAGVLPATGTDGHADIVDPVTNTIHSFWQLKQNDGRWTAALYSWSNLAGTGWGDPAHYYQGARAVGVPASAGLIRKHEIKDGLPVYHHALALSLAHNALSNGVNGPAYIFPATSADNTLTTNTGAIPEGALLMLPPGFDTGAIDDPKLRKIAETLKVYGAYVVDRNDGTPFVIYVENDAGFHLMRTGWDNKIASQLDTIRAGLRQVTSAQAWIDAKGNDASAAIKAQRNMNILSMRGPWQQQAGTAAASYDTATQRLVFDATITKTVYVNSNNTGMTRVSWAVPKAGAKFTFSVSATGGAALRMQLNTNGQITFDSKELKDGQSVNLTWPASAKVTLIATSGTKGASSVRANLVLAP